MARDAFFLDRFRLAAFVAPKQEIRRGVVAKTNPGARCHFLEQLDSDTGVIELGVDGIDKPLTMNRQVCLSPLRAEGFRDREVRLEDHVRALAGQRRIQCRLGRISMQVQPSRGRKQRDIIRVEQPARRID
jgi:hypothetical protein